MSNERLLLIDSALDFFKGFYGMDKASKKDIILDETYIDIKADTIKQLIPKLTEEDLLEIKKKIKSIYAIYQPNGVAILNDYEHFDNWYGQLDLKEQFFWDRYKKHLQDERFPPNVVEKLDKDTLNNLMSYIGNPNSNEQFSRKGLVIGDVQSDKTSNYIGLICKAVDAGYKVIFLLTGTIESLRQQTQTRVEEGFIGYDIANSEDVGVKRGQIVPYAFTSREKDFVKGSENTTALLIETKTPNPYIFVIKKNVSVLKKINAAIKRNLHRDDKKVKFPMIMIDDECDNASINTNNKDNAPTQTNAYIRRILALFEKSNYIGFTATPFANVFIDPDTDDDMLNNDLFPKDFIYALFPPSNYHGAKKMFVDKDEENDSFMLEIIDPNAETLNDIEKIFPMGHKKEWYGTSLPLSTYEAVDRFLLSNSIRDLDEPKKHSHRSMLINMSRFMAVQFVITDLIKEYVNNTKNDIRLSWKLTPKESITNKSVARLYALFNEEYKNCRYSWEDVFKVLLDSINNIDIITVNSSKQSSKLSYKKHENGYRVIAIGGMALSRGLTLEGLMISYFYRNSATFDVLMQMGRWFGYREGYENLCKVYLSKVSAKYYKEIIESTEQLKMDMKRMCDKKQRPEEFGIRVRNDFYNKLRITAATKMKNTKQKIVHKDFWGDMFYTPFLDYGEDNDINISLTKDLIGKYVNKRDEKVYHPYFRDIEKTDIIQLLEDLRINTDMNDNFDVKQLIGFIQNKTEKPFDILIMGGDNEEVDFCKSIKIKPVGRKYELMSSTNMIRLNHYRLGGNRDTANGLDPEIVKKIDKENNGKNEKNYLVNKRNPLLIIYMVNPCNSKNFKDEDEHLENILAWKDLNNKAKEKEFEYQQSQKEQPYLIGYQIGFPKCDDFSGQSHSYIVNITADYYKLHTSYFDNGEDE